MNTTPLWRKVQRTNFRSLESLLEFLEMDASNLAHIENQPRFSLNVPMRLARKMKKNTIHDPLFRQFVPLAQEKQRAQGFSDAPVQDEDFRQEKKLLKKYANRALLLCTEACAMNCRFCFRQNFPYDKTYGFSDEIAEIQKDRSIKEVILSGGDPLSLGDSQLRSLISQLSMIPHVQRIRFHSRFVVGIPERIDNSFLSILESCLIQVIFIVHINHPSELDTDVMDSLKKIQKLGIPVLNQSVLLKGVNDDPETLLELSEALVNSGVMPYYLHQLDRVEGAAHFEVEEHKGKQLIDFLSNNSSGYAVPKYVREIPGEKSKVALHSLEGFESQDLKPLLQDSGC